MMTCRPGAAMCGMIDRCMTYGKCCQTGEPLDTAGYRSYDYEYAKPYYPPTPPAPPRPQPKPPKPPAPPKPQPKPYDKKLDEIIALLKQTAKGTERLDMILQMLADVSFDVKGIKQQTSGKAIDESILDAEEMETLGKIAKKICDYATPNITAEQMAKLVYVANLMKK